MTNKNQEKKAENFIEKAKIIHGNTYDYSKLNNYKNNKTKVTIICKIHGEFLQTPNTHLSGHGCIHCGKIKAKKALSSNKEEFITRAKEIHGDKYDYSKTVYNNNRTNVIIICKIHGEYQQTPENHLNGCGCGYCGGTSKSTTEEFIKKSKEIHKDQYDYSKSNYINNSTKVIIICKTHGEFLQKPNHHLCGQGCPLCGMVSRAINKTSNTEEFITRAKELHGDKYDYSKVEYIKAINKVIIICKTHGEFIQQPKNHLIGQGCSLCGIETCKNKTKNSIEEFTTRAKEIHGDKYNYSKVEYINTNTKIIIICKEHGEFTKTPNNHLSGQGCPKCQDFGYSKVQIVWLDFLSKLYNIKIQHAKNDTEFIIPNTKYRADGYCPETNTIFEFHGDYWHGNPKVFNPNTFNATTKCTYGELYKRTIDREQCIKNAGFNLITIWESEWHKINKGISMIQRAFRTTRK